MKINGLNWLTLTFMCCVLSACGGSGGGEADSDGDGVIDSQDAFPQNRSESKDSDGDGVGDNTDNCFITANLDQLDSDQDLKGDACDNDIDGDNVNNSDDAYPLDPTESKDTDNDTVADGLDNCPAIANPSQEDANSDQEGDACDDDIDGDTVNNSDDAFPLDATETQDTDNDGVGDGKDLSINNPDLSYVELDRLIATNRISTTFTGTDLFDRLGTNNSFTNLGDINGDGIEDLAIIMTGDGAVDQTLIYEWTGNFHVHIILGGTPLPINVTKASIENISAFKFVIADVTTAWNSGLIEIMPVGDFNNDGLQDFAILNKTKIVHENIAEVNAGALYLVYGRTTWPAIIEESSIVTDYGFRITRVAEHDELEVIKSAGDLNGDGIQDMFITFAESDSYTNDLDNPDAKAYFPYIVFGGDSSPKGEINPNDLNSTRLIDTTQTQSSKLGAEVVSLGDFNGDEYDDFAILDSSYYINEYDGGYLYIVYGKKGWLKQTDLSTLTLDDGYVIAGYYDPEAGVNRGIRYSKIASAKDINGDGLNDMHISGASFHRDSVEDSGQYGYDMIILGGQQFTQVKNNIVDIQDDILFYPGDDFKRRYTQPQFIDDINGDNIADMIIGVRNYDDNLTNGEGTGRGGVYVIYGKQPFYTDLNFSQLTPSQGFFIHNKNGFSEGPTTETTFSSGLIGGGTAMADGLGWQVGSLGDWDDNGTQDIYFTMPNYDTGGQQEGFGQGKIFIMPLDLNTTLYGAQ